MTPQAKQVITWCQPPDTSQDDVIAIDGRFLTADEVELRREAVARINEFARKGPRVDLPERGWKREVSSGVVAQVPVSSGDPAVKPSVAALVPAGDTGLLARAVTQVVDTAERAGYRVSPEEVEYALRFQSPRPKGLIARVMQWIKNLFRFGGPR